MQLEINLPKGIWSATNSLWCMVILDWIGGEHLVSGLRSLASRN